jgi:hypothetical protein
MFIRSLHSASLARTWSKATSQPACATVGATTAVRGPLSAAVASAAWLGKRFPPSDGGLCALPQHAPHYPQAESAAAGTRALLAAVSGPAAAVKGHAPASTSHAPTVSGEVASALSPAPVVSSPARLEALPPPLGLAAPSPAREAGRRDATASAHGSPTASERPGPGGAAGAGAAAGEGEGDRVLRPRAGARGSGLSGWGGGREGGRGSWRRPAAAEGRGSRAAPPAAPVRQLR